MNYYQLSFRVFGGLAGRVKDYFSSMHDDIKKAKLGISLEEYISGILMGWFLSLVAFSILFASLFLAIMSPLDSAITALTISILFSSIVFAGFYLYPSMVVSARSKKIDISIPFTTIYFATISSGKVTPLEMFRIVGEMKGYGEISKECREIVKNVELLGMSTEQAIARVSEKTPSRKFKELLDGIYFNISSGGNLYQYLREKAEIFMTEYRDMLKKYSQTLGMMIQIYLTLIIVGSVFFIILSTIMNMVSGTLESVFMQFFTVFVLLPLISGFFIVVIKMLSPE